MRILERVDGLKFDVSPFKGSSVKNISLANEIIATYRSDGSD